ncbi:hypothetical protein BKA62DRAFT_706152 [Auriculariales sp. MPI-PUGE-AT-0066]|nr:hypothetical protein BKA62DRAFT_706152 [Auriculariales sp. MPI-PUGE-AT-0066]
MSTMMPPPPPPAVASAKPDTRKPSNAPEENMVASLEGQVKLLQDLLKTARGVKDKPARMLAAATSDMKSAASGISVIISGKIASDFVQSAKETLVALEEVHAKVRAPEAQKALEAARTPLPAAASFLSRKRKRQDSDAPKPARLASAPRRIEAAGSDLVSSTLPPDSPTRTRVKKGNMIPFLRTHNSGSSTLKIRIWQPQKAAKPRADGCTILKMTLPDLFNSYVTFEEGSDELLVVSANVFGVTEQRPLHAQSEFDVFKLMTQYLTRLINDSGDVSLTRIASFLETYTSAFNNRPCSACMGVISAADHTPPIEFVGNDTWKHSVCHYVLEEDVDEHGNPKVPENPMEDQSQAGNSMQT